LNDHPKSLTPPIGWLCQPPPPPPHSPPSVWQQLLAQPNPTQPLATLILSDSSQRVSQPFNHLWALIALERYSEALILIKEFNQEQRRLTLFQKLAIVLMINLGLKRDSHKILENLAASESGDFRWLHHKWRRRFDPEYAILDL